MADELRDTNDHDAAVAKKRRKKRLAILAGVMAALIGGCTAIGLVVDSPEAALAKTFFKTLYKSDAEANASMCQVDMTPTRVEANRKGLVTLRRELVAKGWTGGQSLDKTTKEIKAGSITVTLVKGKLLTKPSSKIEVGLVKYPKQSLCVATLGVDGKDFAGNS
jgi:hypothetical protein